MTDTPDQIWAWVDYDGTWDGTWLADSVAWQPRSPDAHYLRATPARLHANSLLAILSEIDNGVIWGDWLDRRNALLARIEGEKP